jgi:hypothetical protein
MADVTDPTAIGFVVNSARPAACSLWAMYNLAKAVTVEFVARGGSSFIPNDAEAEILDGAQSDSRPVVYGSNVTTLYNRLADLVADYEANSNAKLNQIIALATQTGGVL